MTYAIDTLAVLVWLTTVALGCAQCGILKSRQLSRPCHTLPDAQDARPPDCLNISAAILTIAVRLGQDMIGRLLGSGVNLFKLNFNHLAQAEHEWRSRSSASVHSQAHQMGELGRQIFVIRIMVLLA